MTDNLDTHFADAEYSYVERARVGRLATTDGEGRPSVVPVCFALTDDRIVTPIDEKPKADDPTSLRRVRDVRANPRVTLVVDHYVEDWDALGWVQIRGTARILDAATCEDDAGTHGHESAIDALRAKYDQYADHALEARPVIAIDPGSVRSWGDLST